MKENLAKSYFFIEEECVDLLLSLSLCFNGAQPDCPAWAPAPCSVSVCILGSEAARAGSLPPPFLPACLPCSVMFTEQQNPSAPGAAGREWVVWGSVAFLPAGPRLGTEAAMTLPGVLPRLASPRNWQWAWWKWVSSLLYLSWERLLISWGFFFFNSLFVLLLFTS